MSYFDSHSCHYISLLSLPFFVYFYSEKLCVNYILFVMPGGGKQNKASFLLTTCLVDSCLLVFLFFAS
jgi:hypothetical protein